MPKLFYTNASAKAEIAELEGKVSTLETNATADAAEIERLTGELATAKENLSAVTTERDEAAAAVTEAEVQITTLRAELSTAQAAVADFDTKVENAAQAKFASLGGPPIQGKQDDNTGKAISELTGLEKVTAAFAAKNKSQSN